MEQGQVAAPQPAIPEMPAVLTHGEAVAFVSQAIQEAEKAETTETPRGPDGKFVSKPEAEPKAEPDKQEAPVEAKEEAAPAEEVKAEEPAPKWKLKLNYKGEDREVEEDEARELAQKGYDYTQKTQALAKEREELQASIKSQSETARKQYEQQLEIYRQSVLKLADPEVLSADLGKIAETDPARALQLSLKRQQLAETLQAVEAEQQKVIRQRHEEQQELYKKQALEAVDKLRERVPGWNHDLYGKILKGAVDTYGYKQAEVNSITDYRAIEVLNDALQWRAYKAAKPTTVYKRVAAVPKVVKPGTTEKADPNANKQREAMERLGKTGSRADAESVVMEMFRAGKL